MNKFLVKPAQAVEKIHANHVKPIEHITVCSIHVLALQDFMKIATLVTYATIYGNLLFLNNFLLILIVQAVQDQLLIAMAVLIMIYIIFPLILVYAEAMSSLPVSHVIIHGSFLYYY